LVELTNLVCVLVLVSGLVVVLVDLNLVVVMILWTVDTATTVLVFVLRVTPMQPQALSYCLKPPQSLAYAGRW